MLIVIFNCLVRVRFVSVVSEESAASEDVNFGRINPDLSVDHVGMEKLDLVVLLLLLLLLLHK